MTYAVLTRCVFIHIRESGIEYTDDTPFERMYFTQGFLRIEDAQNAARNEWTKAYAICGVTHKIFSTVCKMIAMNGNHQLLPIADFDGEELVPR